MIVFLEGISKDGRGVSCSTIVYVSPSADGFFLTLEAMLVLGLVTPDSEFYPTELRIRDESQSQNASLAEGDQNCCSHDTHSSSCSCPPQSSVPRRPRALPFPATAENNA